MSSVDVVFDAISKASRYDKREKVHGDAVYEAWRSGANPDAVDYDLIDDDFYSGFSPEECVANEVRRLRQEEKSDGKGGGE